MFSLKSQKTFCTQEGFNNPFFIGHILEAYTEMSEKRLGPFSSCWMDGWMYE